MLTINLWAKIYADASKIPEKCYSEETRGVLFKKIFEDREPSLSETLSEKIIKFNH